MDYDCRFQPWFIDGDGCSKDIIIAFDLRFSPLLTSPIVALQSYDWTNLNRFKREKADFILFCGRIYCDDLSDLTIMMLIFMAITLLIIDGITHQSFTSLSV